MHQMPPTSSFSNFLTMAAGDLDALDAQVAEQRFVDVPLLVERHRHLVDDLEAAPLADRGLDLLGFVGPDVVLGQNLLDGVAGPPGSPSSSLEAQYVPEQVFQDVDGDVRPFLDQLGQVLADDLARRSAGSGGRRARCRACWFQKSSVNALSIIDLHALLLDAGFGVPQHEAVGRLLVVRAVLQDQGAPTSSARPCSPRRCRMSRSRRS